MIIGIPKEIKNEEYRVGMTPAGVSELRKLKHTVLVEKGAGEGSGFSDEEYLKADGDVVDRKTLFSKADLVVKVKEPLPPEFPLMREGQAVFTYLHLAPNKELIEFLLKKKITGLAYETLEKDGNLPLLAPMSEVAGRMAPVIGMYYLQKAQGGKGILPTGVPGVKPGKAVILGAGVVGASAARVCVGLGMDTCILNRGLERLQRLDELYAGRIKTIALTNSAVSREIQKADIVIGAVLVPGGRTPVLITKAMLKTMQKGSVIIDVAVDQGGCFETTNPTTHDDPVYTVDGIIHYCVANMPGAYPRTSTIALTNATLPYVKLLAERGLEKAIHEDPSVRSALNTFRGNIVHRALAESIKSKYK